LETPEEELGIETFKLETRHWPFNAPVELPRYAVSNNQGRVYIRETLLPVLPDDRDDSNLHCSASEGPGSRRRARMNGAGAMRACPCLGSYACRRENGSNAPYTSSIVSIVNGHESVVVVRLCVYGRCWLWKGLCWYRKRDEDEPQATNYYCSILRKC